MTSLVVVIPTRNRMNYLHALLHSLELQIKSPDLVVIVDSSDLLVSPTEFQYSLPLVYLPTKIRSAAMQRNLGIDFVAKQNFANFIISFLDDDVLVPRHYLRWQYNYLMENPHTVGLSGVTAQESNDIINNVKLLRLVGYTGIAGSITKAAINIAPKTTGKPLKVQWLIGCSAWNFKFIKDLRFESDFIGNSIFEDVIFSYRASEFGQLVCAPELKFTHRYAQIGRESIEGQYFSWISNRYRIFKYNRGDFTKKLFWINSIFLAISHFSMALFFRKTSWRKFMGITKGMLAILKGGVNGKDNHNSAG